MYLQLLLKHQRQLACKIRCPNPKKGKKRYKNAEPRLHCTYNVWLIAPPNSAN